MPAGYAGFSVIQVIDDLRTFLLSVLAKTELASWPPGGSWTGVGSQLSTNSSAECRSFAACRTHLTKGLVPLLLIFTAGQLGKACAVMRLKPCCRRSSGNTISWRQSPATRCSTSNPSRRIARIDLLLNGGRLRSPQPSNSMTQDSPNPFSLWLPNTHS